MTNSPKVSIKDFNVKCYFSNRLFGKTFKRIYTPLQNWCSFITVKVPHQAFTKIIKIFVSIKEALCTKLTALYHLRQLRVTNLPHQVRLRQLKKLLEKLKYLLPLQTADY